MKRLWLGVCLAAAAFGQSGLNTNVWGVLNRAGDYSNSETQCYLPANVSVANSLLSLVFKSQTQTCGDTNHTATSHSFTAGNVYWKTFTWQYGTLEFKGNMTPNHSVWTAIWMLGVNCQATWGNTADNSGACNWPQNGSQ